MPHVAGDPRSGKSSPSRRVSGTDCNGQLNVDGLRVGAAGQGNGGHECTPAPLLTTSPRRCRINIIYGIFHDLRRIPKAFTTVTTAVIQVVQRSRLGSSRHLRQPAHRRFRRSSRPGARRDRRLSSRAWKSVEWTRRKRRRARCRTPPAGRKSLVWNGRNPELLLQTLF